MIKTRLVFVVSLVFLVCGCHFGSTNLSSSPTAPSSSVAVTSGLVEINPDMSADVLAIDTAASDSLIQSGFVFERDHFINQYSQAIQMDVHLSNASFQLLTRIGENAQIPELGKSPVVRSFVKDSSLVLRISELRLIRAGQLDAQKLKFESGDPTFSLAPSESVEIDWVLRASPTIDVCPFWSTQNYAGLVPSENYSVQWAFLGSALKGSFGREVTATLPSGESVLVDSQSDRAVFQAAGDSNANSQDRSFGCDGLMQALTGS